MQPKSPFYVAEEFVSPMMCEDIIDDVNFTVPNLDKDEHPIKTIKRSELVEQQIYQRVWLAMPELQAYYKFLYKGTEHMQFEWFPEGCRGDFICENSQFSRNKWLRTRQRDFTGILFLSDYQDKIPFEDEFEVYGGKLEFTQHHFSFNPQRGTLIVFPSDPHFINVTSPVLAGDLYQVRIQIAAQSPYIYDPQQFPGDYRTWFASHLN